MPPRRITFVRRSGGDCWKLREQLVNAITKQDLKPNGRVLRVNVQEPPDGAVRKGRYWRYWRAVYALKKQLKEDDDYLIAPNDFAIYDAKTLELLGQLSETSYIWDTDMLTKCFPDLNILQLRKASLKAEPRARRQ